MANPWNWKALAVALGTFVGAYVFLATVFAMNGVEFWWFNSETLTLLTAAFPITLSIGGAIVGLVLGFLCGAFCGGVLAWLYNQANKKWK
ncbi:MAG: hypothetical protein AABX82_09200 [Nanoarchaeota archaeon]